jgi:aryl-alcohol dehydrogenase-like predicted oxidoreductase
VGTLGGQKAYAVGQLLEQRKAAHFSSALSTSASTSLIPLLHMGSCLVELVNRDELVIISKVGYPGKTPNQHGLSRKHMFASIDATLKRLRTDYVDVLVIHRDDFTTPIEEIMTGLAEIVRAGKARYIGVSTIDAYRFIQMHLFAKANGFPRFILMQNLYNLLYREPERDTIPFCIEEGIGISPYSALARGILSGTRNRQGEGSTERARGDKKAVNFLNDAGVLILDQVVALAKEHNVKPSQIALSWLFNKPGVVGPVIGPTALNHIDEAVEAMALKLSPEEMSRLEGPYQARAVMV